MGLLATLGLQPKVHAGVSSAAVEERGDDDEPAAAAGDKGGEKAAYEAARDAAQKLLDGLNANPQKAHLATEIADATAKLATAKGHADKSEWPQAMAAVEEARKACVAAGGFGTQFAAYLAKRADATVLMHAATVAGQDMTANEAKAAAADLKAAAPTRNYAGAGADLDAVMAAVGGKFKKLYVDDTAPQIAALKAKPAAKFVAIEIADVDALQKQVVDGIAAKQWRKVDLTGRQLGRRITAAGRMADWRQNFDTQRPQTVLAIQGLKANKALAGQGVLIDKRLEDADKLATREAMQMDEAIKALREIEASCASLLKLADGAAAYASERKPADDAYAALGTHKAAKQIEKEIAAVGKQLDSAATLAGDAGPGSPRGVIKDDPKGQNFEAARGVIKQAVTDLAAAKKVADDLTGVAAVQAVAGAAPDPKAITKAVADLRRDAAAAAKEPHADLAKTELDNCEAALKEVEAKVADKQPEVAAVALTGASLQLVAARKLQVEHARFIELQKTLEARRTALLPDPIGSSIKARLDALKAVLDSAAAQDKAGAFADAAATLHQAEAAAKDAEAAAAARKAYDERSAKSATLIADAKYAAIKTEQDKLLAQALAKANAFDFDAAAKLLDTIDNRAEAAGIEKLAKDSPGDAKLVDSCKKMLAKGGAAEVDALIQRLPDDVDKSVIEKLAKERFGGLQIEADAGNDAQKALKQMCKLMAVVPPDVTKKNPSLQKISRIAAGGASYNAGKSEVKMNERPNQSPKADFPSAAGRLPEREEACKPANDNPEDLFDFNMLHELAHSIDDSNHFMAARETQEAFGGWIDHGGNVEPIAAAVAHELHFEANDAEKKYVLDLVLGNVPVVPPRPAVDGDKWDTAKDNVDKWVTRANKANVWSNQAESEKLVIGSRIYHVAYPNRWVSYSAAARKRGITGYQFRAPGEWFSELYAAYKRGKLKPEHPSAGWLSKLSL